MGPIKRYKIVHNSVAHTNVLSAMVQSKQNGISVGFDSKFYFMKIGLCSCNVSFLNVARPKKLNVNNNHAMLLNVNIVNTLRFV